MGGHQHTINKGVVTKLNQTTRTISGTIEVQSLCAVNNAYRAPRRGEVVEVSGLLSRPELNGSVGEVLSSASDEGGRVVVRIVEQGGREATLRIQPHCLSRVGAHDGVNEFVKKHHSSSVPSLHGSIASSAKSSRSARSRALGPAISAGARGAMSAGTS